MYSDEFTPHASKAVELYFMKDSSMPPLFDVLKNNPKKAELDLLVDSAINSYCGRDYKQCQS